MTPDEMEDDRDLEDILVEDAEDGVNQDDYDAAVNSLTDSYEVLELIRKLDMRDAFMTRNMRIRVEGILNEINAFLGLEE